MFHLTFTNKSGPDEKNKLVHGFHFWNIASERNCYFYFLLFIFCHRILCMVKGGSNIFFGCGHIFLFFFPKKYSLTYPPFVRLIVVNIIYWQVSSSDTLRVTTAKLPLWYVLKWKWPTGPKWNNFHCFSAKVNLA